jgi:hypothetical protein
MAWRGRREPDLLSSVEMMRRVNRPKTVTIVTGPPGAGKSHFVRERMRPGDLVIDFDLIYQALSGGLPMYERPESLRALVWDVIHLLWDKIEAREVAIDRRQPPVSSFQDCRTWIILSGTNYRLAAMQQRFNAELVVLAEKPAVCMARCAGRAGSVDWAAAIDEWWRCHKGGGGTSIPQGVAL